VAAAVVEAAAVEEEAFGSCRAICVAFGLDALGDSEFRAPVVTND
jgi:hypothetical protein